MKIVIPARARINSQSDVSRAIFRQTSISVHGSRHVHTNESRPGPGWSVSNRTRELRNPCDRIFRRRRSRSIHDLAYGYRHTFRQITCSPRLLIPSFSLSGKIIDPPFSTNCPFLVFRRIYWTFPIRIVSLAFALRSIKLRPIEETVRRWVR